MTIAKNERTIKLGRVNRFVIDDGLSPTKLTYTLSKPMKIGHVYNDEGIYAFVLQEVNSSEYDNLDLCIADYYKYFPKTPGGIVDPYNKIDPEHNEDENGRKVWL